MNVNSNNLPISEANLNKLIALAKDGQNDSLSDIYEIFHGRVYRFIFYRVSHRETAEDLTEEVFVKAFRSLHKLEKPEAFTGWLFQIARNLIIDYYRKKKQNVSLESVENTLIYEANTIDTLNLELNQTIAIKLMTELTEEQQSVIKMKFIEELDNETIATILGKTEGAIRVIQHRALTKLTELFKSKIEKI